MVNTSLSQFLNRIINNYASYIICALFVILVIVKFHLASNFSGPFIFPDETIYDSVAQNIVHGKLYGKLGVASSGYPLLLSLAYYVCNNQVIVYRTMLAISAFVTSSIVFPSYFILEKYCSKIVSVLGAITVSTLTALNFYSFTLMTEALFIPLFLFSVWFVLKIYETNNKKWALLASLSTVYLYITRSTGLAMLIAFVVTFICHLFLNFKDNRPTVLIKKNILLITFFIIFISCWLIYSANFVDINQPFNDELTNTYNYGSTYSIKNVSEHVIDIFASIENLLIFIKLFINLIGYLLLASSFLLFFIIYYFILLFANRKSFLDHKLSMPILYAFISSTLLIVSTIGFLFQRGIKNLIFGRYIEPTIPIIMIIGIICISNFDQKMPSKKNIVYFTLVSIPIILIIPCIFAWDNIIINVFNDLQDNPTLYAYNIFYGYPKLKTFTIFYGSNFTIPKQIVLYLSHSLLMSGYFLVIIALIALSMKNKRYISLLLIFIIISSLTFSTSLYHISVTKSNDGDNSIAKFLANNTNDETIYLTDDATTYKNVGIERYVYGFWNKGDTENINSKNISQKITERYKKIYLISINSHPYDKVANDGNFTLYKVA